MTTAIVPFKRLDAAKRRLAGVISSEQRAQLMLELLRRVVAACRTSGAVEEVLVVCGDDRGAQVAHGAGARTLREPRASLQAALDAADELVGDRAATLVLPADLPFCTPEAVHLICTADMPTPGVAVVPTSDGGTGALLRRPGPVIPTAFGSGSADRHLQLALAARAAALRLHVPQLARDVDRPEDLRVLGRVEGLRESGLGWYPISS